MKIFRLVALLLLVTSTAEAITIATVPVGNPGNAPDPASDGFVPDLGSVGYTYSIGKYDVTVGQYTAFLNAVAATDTYGLYNSNMATNLNIAGISQSGSSGSYSYSVIGSPLHPITYVSWGDAARFANWMNNGQPTGGESLSTTEDGSYFLNGANTYYSLDAVTRKAGATWVLPTENEWYKAAYYDSAHSTYYQYPFSSNNVPTSAMPGSTANTGNFTTISRAFAVTGSTSYSPSQNYLTDVGAYTGSASPYGAFDMGGDVWQWTETYNFDADGRGHRGGAWSLNRGQLQVYYFDDPTGEGSTVGFRVAEMLLGDFNQDTHVDARDIAAMMSALTDPNGYRAAHNNLTDADLLIFGDINHDGKFNNADLQYLLSTLIAGGGSTDSVPEPSTLVLAVLAFGLFGVRRWGR